MSDTFLPGSGFDTYESQDKVLVQMDGSRECAVAVRILQQQGFAVAGAAVRLAAEQTADAESAKKAAEALGIECIVLNAEALAGQDADVLGEGGTPLFAALLTAADKLGMQYVATTHRARVETGADGVHTVCPPAGAGSDDSTILAALPQETLARLILPLGDFAPEDVAEMMNNVELRFSYRAEQEQKKLVLFGEEDIFLSCDRDWILEAVDNIVKNAMDHTKSGDTIEIKWRKSASIVQIQIKDNGSGIHPEDLHHIFKRFYRSRFSKDQQGIGLGLPLAKMIIEAHNGTIEVNSELGKGTKITIIFPKQKSDL